MKQILRDLLISFLKSHPSLLADSLKAGGFHVIPLEHDFNPRPRWGYESPPHPSLYNLINKNREGYRDLLQKFLQLTDCFQAVAKEDVDGSWEPSWTNPWFPPFDSLSLYSIISIYQPNLYIEIGSGNSTKFARKSISDNKLSTKIISIDPEPRVEINRICDKIIRKRLEDIDLEIFNEMKENDIIFIDSSHLCLMNSDVTILFLDILPNLNKNVLVHLHDIFLPFDYPQGWEERYYSEQYILAAYILANNSIFDILLPNFFISQDQSLNSILAPIWESLNLHEISLDGGSFWIKIR